MYLQILNRLVQDYPAIREKATAYLHELRPPQQGGAASIHAPQS